MRLALMWIAVAGCLGGVVIQAIRVASKYRAKSWRPFFASLSMMLAAPGWAVAALYAGGWLREGARWPVLFVSALVATGLSWSLYRVNLHVLYGSKTLEQLQIDAMEEFARHRREAANVKHLPPAKRRK